MIKSWTLCLALAVLPLGLLSCGDGAKKDVDNAETILVTAPMSRGEVTRVVNASGKIVPKDEVMVGSEVSGRVLKVNVDFNSHVKAGDILAQINPETFEISLRQLEARMQSALADIQVQNASINRANVNWAQSKIVLKRKADLFAQEAVSQAQLEEAQRSVGVSEADVKLAEARLESAKAQVNQIKALIGNAEANLAKTIIRSPIDGVVIDRKVDPGQTVQASFSAPELFAIAADLSDIRVEAQIVESDVAGLEKGDKAKFTVDAYPDMSVVGAVEQLRLKSKESNNIVTYVAVVSAKNDTGRLMPGMTANLEIITEVKSNVMRVPASAERFRPTPDQLEKWETKAEETGTPPNLNEPVYVRLKRIGMGGNKLKTVREVLDKATKPMRDIINDPEKSFMQTPMKMQLGKVTVNILKTQLSPTELSDYNALIASERNIRDGKLWLQTTDGKMRQQAVKFGLSDGAFIEIISGLKEGDKVVTSIKAKPKSQSKSKPKSKPKSRSK